jgi:hypothetical protein
MDMGLKTEVFASVSDTDRSVVNLAAAWHSFFGFFVLFFALITFNWRCIPNLEFSFVKSSVNIVLHCYLFLSYILPV